MKKYMKIILPLLALSLSMGTAEASNFIKTAWDTLPLGASENTRNETHFQQGDTSWRFMANRNKDGRFELQWVTEQKLFNYGLLYRVREKVHGIGENFKITQYYEQDSGRYFYGIDFLSDEDNSYHSILLGYIPGVKSPDEDGAEEYVNSYLFDNQYIENPHIWCENGKLYLGDRGPSNEYSPRYELYWSEESQWFGYHTL